MRCPRCGTPQPHAVTPESGWEHIYTETHNCGGLQNTLERYLCPDCIREGGVNENSDFWKY